MKNIKSVISSAMAGVNRALPRPVRLTAVAVGATVAGTVARAQSTGLFDVSTLYSGATTAFTAAATIAGGFLAIKYAKVVKKAWAWLT